MEYNGSTVEPALFSYLLRLLPKFVVVVELAVLWPQSWSRVDGDMYRAGSTPPIVMLKHFSCLLEPVGYLLGGFQDPRIVADWAPSSPAIVLIEAYIGLCRVC